MNSMFRVGVFLRGLLMGAADVVPGVSGGTIALITGIYEELINSIKNIQPNLITTWRKEGFSAFWKAINGPFLVSLFLGIGISLFSLAKLITYLLSNFPILVWAFFFGLILASAIYVGKQVKKWNVVSWLLLLLGAAVAYWITTISPAQGNNNIAYLFMSGAIAICAMILPGISGSLIALLLGVYVPVVKAVESLDIKGILPFAFGAVVGLLLFSHVLSWLFKRYYSPTLALLTGFMIGALNKVWPWKETVKTYIDRHGEEQPLLETNIAPTDQLLPAVGLAILGFVLVFFLERVAKSNS
ncbi:MAG: DUF368 domain-containing protein [Saprospiraceae bacterium]|nr:DUF368 domain-containing protein [Saprospiraceae bacterium]